MHLYAWYQFVATCLCSIWCLYIVMYIIAIAIHIPILFVIGMLPRWWYDLCQQRPSGFNTIIGFTWLRYMFIAVRNLVKKCSFLYFLHANIQSLHWYNQLHWYWLSPSQGIPPNGPNNYCTVFCSACKTSFPGDNSNL